MSLYQSISKTPFLPWQGTAMCMFAAWWLQMKCRLCIAKLWGGEMGFSVHWKGGKGEWLSPSSPVSFPSVLGKEGSCQDRGWPIFQCWAGALLAITFIFPPPVWAEKGRGWPNLCMVRASLPCPKNKPGETRPWSLQQCMLRFKDLDVRDHVGGEIWADDSAEKGRKFQHWHRWGRRCHSAWQEPCVEKINSSWAVVYRSVLVIGWVVGWQGRQGTGLFSHSWGPHRQVRAWLRQSGGFLLSCVAPAFIRTPCIRNPFTRFWEELGKRVTATHSMVHKDLAFTPRGRCPKHLVIVMLSCYGMKTGEWQESWGFSRISVGFCTTTSKTTAICPAPSLLNAKSLHLQFGNSSPRVISHLFPFI